MKLYGDEKVGESRQGGRGGGGKIVGKREDQIEGAYQTMPATEKKIRRYNQTK